MKTALLAVSLLAATALGQDAPLTQADALDAALSSQPSLRAAEARLDAATAREEQARLGRLGSLSTSLAWTPLQRGQQIDVPGFGGTEPETFEMRQTERLALGVSLSQPLWTWGALSGQLRSAQEEREAARLESDWAREQLVFEVTRAFATAVATGEAEEVARRDRAQREELLRVARSRVEAASAAPLDALQAEVALAEAESALLQAVNRRRLAREALVTLTVDTRFRTALLAPPPDLDGPLPAEDEAVAAARAGRSDLASLRAQVGSLGAGAAASRASGKPSSRPAGDADPTARKRYAPPRHGGAPLPGGAPHFLGPGRPGEGEGPRPRARVSRNGAAGGPGRGRAERRARGARGARHGRRGARAHPRPAAAPSRSPGSRPESRSSPTRRASSPRSRRGRRSWLSPPPGSGSLARGSTP